MAAPARRYVNGFVDGTDLVLLYRNPAGLLCKEIRRAEWSSFHPRAQVSAQVLRDLRGSQYVAGVVEEGEYVRVKWGSPEWRARSCAGEVQVDGKWVPGYFAENGVECLEADVDPVRRYFADTGASIALPRRAYLDIETDSRVPPAIARQGKARVLCWAVADDQQRPVARAVLAEDTDEAEKSLLDAFWAALADFDQVCAWFGDLFDFPIVKLRSEKLGASVKDWRRWLWMDHAEIFERMNKNASESGGEKESRALQHVAMETVGEGKTEFDASRTYEEWAAGGERRARLVEYCGQDVVLLPKVEAKTGYLATNASVCEACGVFPDTDSANPLTFIDGFMLRLGATKGHRFPTPRRPEKDEKHEQFAGAFVLEPQVSGIRRGVHVFDFSGMYPSIILSFNIAAESKAPYVPVNGPIPPGHCRSPATRVGFRTSPRGIICEALLEIRKLRKYWQELQASLPAGTPEWYDAGRRSNAYKVIANSFYGATGSVWGRYYDRQLAESTTQTGVYLIRRTLEAAEARGMKAVYGDTDSGFVENATREEVREFVAWCNRELYPQILRDAGCSENFVEVAYEKEFERVVFVSKKRYAGVFRHYKWITTCECDAPARDGKTKPGALDLRTMACRDCGKTWSTLPPPRGKPEIKGLEYKRGDANLLTRRLQAAAIDLLMRERCEDPAAFVPMIEGMRAHVLSASLTVREVAFAKSLTKSLREYKPRMKPDGVTPMAENAHVQVARILKERGEQVGEGVKVSYVVVDASSSPMKVIPAADYAGELDRFFLWENHVYPATQRLLEAAFPAEPGMGSEALVARDWRRFERVRPKKERGRKGVPEFGTRVPGRGAAEKPEAEGPQASLFGPPTPPPPAAPAGPFVVDVDARGLPTLPATMAAAIVAALERHPGERPVEVHLATAEGRFVLDLPQKVAWSAALVRDVEAAKAVAA